MDEEEFFAVEEDFAGGERDDESPAVSPFITPPTRPLDPLLVEFAPPPPSPPEPLLWFE